MNKNLQNGWWRFLGIPLLALFAWLANDASIPFWKQLLTIGLTWEIVRAVYLLNFKQWKTAFLENEKLQKVSLLTQVDSLKNQINPHFLFNSLNTLSSLVSRDNQQAEQFIDDMSAIYRYLLQHSDKELITLGEELEFIWCFFHLLKTRHGDGIVLTTDAERSFLDYRLPPLTLQMLVENAVKHNVISAHRPLEIRIYIDEVKQLVVENNIHRKTTTVCSGKAGLANIFARYNLLHRPMAMINQTEKLFQVILPLIAPGRK